jgi:hypothetical protein
MSMRAASTTMSIRWAVAAGLVLALACGGTESSGEAAVVRDSAGVSIVTSAEPVWQEGRGWELAQEPTVVLGGPDAPGGEELWRVTALARLPDGSIAVALGEAAVVRIYGPDGTRLATVGRAGHGPGEFERPLSLAAAPPDTLLVLDGNGVQRFLFDGSFLDIRPLPRPDLLGPGTQTVPTAVFPDGSMLGTGMKFLTGPPAPGVVRPEQGVILFPADGAKPLLLGWYPGIEQERIETGQGPRPIVPPFARHTSVAAGGYPDTRIAVGDDATYEIHVFDRSGTLRQIVRRSREPVRVRGEWVEAWKEAQRRAEWTRRQLPALERGWAQMTVPKFLPPYDALAIEDGGYLWVQRMAGEPGAAPTYDIFAPDGRLLGSVQVPAGVRSYPQPVITNDAFVGLWVDDSEVESVRVYALHKPRER